MMNYDDSDAQLMKEVLSALRHMELEGQVVSWVENGERYYRLKTEEEIQAELDAILLS